MKKQTLVFVLITFTISWIEQYFIIKGDGIQNPARAFALMWTPGLVGIACSVFFNRSAKPLAFKMPSLKSLGIAYFTRDSGSFGKWRSPSWSTTTRRD